MTIHVLKPVDYNEIKNPSFPLYATPKIDGIRAYVSNNVLYSASNRPIPNKALQQIAQQLPNGTDMELFCENFRKTTSIVMATDTIIPQTFTVNVFDIMPFDDPGLGYMDRLNLLCRRLRPSFTDLLASRTTLSFTPEYPHTIKVSTKYHTFTLRLHILIPTPINSEEELNVCVQQAVESGGEGIMLRHAHSQYKYGRATPLSQELIRCKPYTDAEALVVGTECQYTNNNEIVSDPSGHSARSSAASGLTPKERLGSFRVVLLHPFLEATANGFPQDGCSDTLLQQINPKELHQKILTGTSLSDEENATLQTLAVHEAAFSIGTGVGLTHDVRDSLWKERKTLIGKIIKFKYLKVGEYDVPRTGVFLGFRHPFDLTVQKSN